ncbi:MAG: matrixin family metalloprotease [Gammaproteobacteria bacterium]|nr:matrixin family metalloprotease [Gammaproteobacteria bacterium]MBL4729729.1 matrixin family metalloprotease [Gammaproteobacteria bacterium]
MRKILTIAVLLLLGQSASGFTFLFEGKNRHLDSSVTFYAGIMQVSPDGRSFNTAFSEAALDWQSQTRISINIINEYLDPCTSTTPVSGFLGGLDGKASIDMTATVCGNDFFGPLAAIALPGGTSPTGPNPGDITDGDIYFNGSLNWDIYDGPRRPDLLDFSRVSLHEIGHILGLSHTIFSQEIMNAEVTDADVLYPDDICGIAILYETPQDCTMLLEGSTSMSGGPTTAIFTGGATADSGASYETMFSSTQSLNVVSTIVVEDAHIGLQGNLYVVVVLADGTLLAKNSDGGFDPITEDINSFPSAESKVLAGANELLILENLVAADLGIANIGLSFYIAYSLVTEPGELYFASTPIRLTITE